MGGDVIHMGLIYSEVRHVIWAHGHTGWRARQIFADVQLMERAALAKLKASDND